MVTTPIFDIPLPTPGADDDAWAPILNDAIVDLEAEISRVDDATAGIAFDLSGKVAKIGDTMAGFLTLNADPVDPLHAATRQYVLANAAGLTDAPNDGTVYGRRNAVWAKVVNAAGDTMTGALALTADPTTALQAATKQYVDTKSGGGIKAVPQLEAVTDAAVVTWGTGAASQGPTLVGNATPLSGDADFLALRARRLSTPAGNGDNAEGAALVLRGPGHPTNPNRAEMITGTGAALRSWLFNADGTLTAPGGITIPQGSVYSLNGGGGAALTVDGSSNLILRVAPGYYMARFGDTGSWAWAENNVTNMTLDSGGSLWIKGSVSVGTNVALNNGGHVGWAGNASFVLRDGSGNFFFQPSPQHRMYWGGADGVWRWQSGAGFANTDMMLNWGNLTLRGGVSASGYYASTGTFGTMGYATGGGVYYCNHIIGNPNWNDIYVQSFYQPSVSAQMRFWVGGSTLFGMRNDGTAYAPGAWQDGCDERVKTDIAPITDALAKIAQIEGITYRRTDIAPLYSEEMLAAHAEQRDTDPDWQPRTNPPLARHAGFLAQSVKAVLPEAITVGETPPDCDPDGEGFNFLNSTAVLALAVQAIKELSARVEQLEATA